MKIYTIALFSFIISVILVFLIREVSLKKGLLIKPRDDRWHKRNTASLGGIGLYLATVISLLIYSTSRGESNFVHWGIILGASIIFSFGLIDDIKHLAPQVKILGQVLAASVIVLMGYTTHFFSPRISNEIIAELPNTLLTIFWIVSITNAINLLDNMDGLASGISLIVSLILSYFFAQAGDIGFLSISIALAGGILGFLIFNFPPASIFMGDSGSQFLGFSLAVLAIAKQPQASNVFAILGVPTILFLLPIFDTLLVTITRMLRGQSPMHGGRDHTSHRLIAFGFSERQAVLGLYFIALLSGLVAIVLESLDYDLSLALIPILVISLVLFTAYLGRIKIIKSETLAQEKRTILRLFLEVAYRRGIFEVLLDLLLIPIALYLAYWIRFGLTINDDILKQFLNALPFSLVGCYISFFIFGIYRDVWGFVGIDTLLKYLKASTGGALFTLLFIKITSGGQTIYFELYLLFSIFLFLGLAATRSSFKIFDLYSNQRKAKGIERALIFGADERGEMVAYWIQMNPEMRVKLVGFITEDPIDVGRLIHGVRILGVIDQLESIIKQEEIQGLILTETNIEDPVVKKIVLLGASNNIWIKIFNFELKLIN